MNLIRITMPVLGLGLLLASRSAHADVRALTSKEMKSVRGAQAQVCSYLTDCSVACHPIPADNSEEVTAVTYWQCQNAVFPEANDAKCPDGVSYECGELTKFYGTGCDANDAMTGYPTWKCTTGCDGTPCPGDGTKVNP